MCYFYYSKKYYTIIIECFLHSTGASSVKDFLSFVQPFTEDEQQLSMVSCFPEESLVHLGWEPVRSQALVSSQGIINRNMGNT